MDILKDVPYIQLDWEDKEIVYVRRHKSPVPIRAAIDIVKKYKTGNFPCTFSDDGTKIESKECVIFLNSVINIVNIVKQCELCPEEVNLIVGSSEENESLISKIGRGFCKGHVPTRGEQHKMFTFCTSTAFAGCDFYSECASTFVISDCTRLNTSIDISTDLV